MKGLVFDIKRFAIHDGPGIRTTVFLKGCPLNCKWCHNPEGKDLVRGVWYIPNNCLGCGSCIQAGKKNVPEIRDGKLIFEKVTRDELDRECIEACPTRALRYDSEIMTVSEVMEQVLRDRKAYANSGGGLTISGGEPTYKQSEFAIELLHAAKDEGIHTAIESCMMTARRIVENMIPIVDYFICDVKILDEKRHEEATGAKNAAILDNIRYIAATGQSMLIRTPLIPGFTDGADNIAAIGEFVASLGGNVEMELLNANPLYFQKYDYSGESIDRSMGKKLSEKQMNELNDILRRKGVKVI